MNESKTRWWVLYTLVPITVGAVALISRSSLPDWLETAISILVVVSGFTAMGMWMNAHEGSIARTEFVNERRRESRRQRTVRAERSHEIAEAEPAPRANNVPLSGFGSARFRPPRTYEQQRVQPDRVRVVVRVKDTPKPY